MKSKPIINLENISFSFNEKKLFERINLTVFQREILMLVGTSGSGLTTFLRLSAGLLEPLEGTVKIFDVALSDASQHQFMKIRQKIGFVFQRGALINNMTLIENIALPLRYHTELKESDIQDIAIEKLSFAGIEEYKTKLPAQLSEECLKRGGLARALALNPELVFYDELSSVSDERFSCSILQLIKQLKEKNGTTTIAVSHDKTFDHNIVDRVATLKDETLEIV